MIKKKIEKTPIVPESRTRKLLPLLILLVIVIGFLGYAGVTLVNSLKAPDHVHSRDDNPDQMKQANQTEIMRLQKLIENEPNNVPALTQLGDLYLQQEEYNAAVKWFNRAHTVDGNNVRVLTGLGNAYRLSEKPDEGLALLRKSIAIDSSYAESWLLLGVVYRFDKNKPDSAQWAWEKFLRLEPTGENAERVKKEIQTIATEKQKRSTLSLPSAVRNY
ncbi:MAG: tetratricopeptide repeat protein [Ignavibacteriales bacterium]|nr:tetratricopeptide repeat protein [Ignavibacteriales bacterium]